MFGQGTDDGIYGCFVSATDNDVGIPFSAASKHRASFPVSEEVNCTLATKLANTRRAADKIANRS